MVDWLELEYFVSAESSHLYIVLSRTLQTESIVSSYIYMWQSQVENEHYSTVNGLIRLVISLECFIEITPDFLTSLYE